MTVLPFATGAEQVPFLKWSAFIADFRWRQGEHVGLIGPTGAGKTSIALQLLPLRRYVTVLATKPRDPTLDSFAKRYRFHKMASWQKLPPRTYPRRIVWPDARELDSVIVQKREFKKALSHIYREGGWCLYIDELWFIIHLLKLELSVRTYLQQGRSLGLSLMVATQRPAFVPLEVYDQSTHLFFWRDNDERNLRRLSGISWSSSRLVMVTIANLEKYEVLYVDTRTGKMVRTIPPDPNRTGSSDVIPR